jgi:hypothetical protein
MDALTMVLGEFRDLHATVATQRPAVRRSDTGEPVAMTAEDQIAVAGRLDSGAVAIAARTRMATAVAATALRGPQPEPAT